MSAVCIAAASVATALVLAEGSWPQGLCMGASSHMMTTLMGVAPGCFSVCSQLCEPMDNILQEYTSGGDASEIMPLICANTEPFNCLYDGEAVKPECKALFEVASGFGIEIPQSEEQLLSACSAGDLCKDALSPMLSTLVGIAPGCFSECDQLCDSMDIIIQKYMWSLGSSDLQSLICANLDPFKCLYDGEELKPVCKAFLEVASALDIEIPQSKEELLSDCSGSLGAKSDGEVRRLDIDAGIDDGNDTNATDDNATIESFTTTVSGNMLSDGASGQRSVPATIAVTLAAAVIAALVSA